MLENFYPWISFIYFMFFSKLWNYGLVLHGALFISCDINHPLNTVLSCIILNKLVFFILYFSFQFIYCPMYFLFSTSITTISLDFGTCHTHSQVAPITSTLHESQHFAERSYSEFLFNYFSLITENKLSFPFTEPAPLRVPPAHPLVPSQTILHHLCILLYQQSLHIPNTETSHNTCMFFLKCHLSGICLDHHPFKTSTPLCFLFLLLALLSLAQIFDTYAYTYTIIFYYLSTGHTIGTQ